MSPTSSSMKTHAGDSRNVSKTTTKRNNRKYNEEKDASRRDKHKRHDPFKNLKYDTKFDKNHYKFDVRFGRERQRFDGEDLDQDDGDSSRRDWLGRDLEYLETPAPVLQSSDGEEDLVSWCGDWDKLFGTRGEALNPCQTEIDVIREWFVNIFQPVEKTADISVTNFKFEHLKKQSDVPCQNGSHGDADLGESNQGATSLLNFRVLKVANVDLKVGKKSKHYSVVIKVLPTDDPERHTDPRKFEALLKFSKEVQVYQNVIHSMAIFDEKRYPSACVEPPVPKCFLSQLDAQNDVIVLENLSETGYKRYGKKHIADYDHCRVVLRRLAHFHAISTLIQRDAEMSLTELYPFAVDASCFQKSFQNHVSLVKEQLKKYLMCSGKRGFGAEVHEESEKKAGSVIDQHLDELFWKLVEQRTFPKDRRLSVLIHGRLDVENILFQYDDVSGRPICAKFLDFSTLTVSSPVIDVTYFLHRSVLPEIAMNHHSSLLQHYLRSHTEAIKSFGMHGFEIDMDTFLQEYKSKQDYGAMMSCLLKPALFVLQSINLKNNLSSHKQQRHEQQSSPSLSPKDLNNSRTKNEGSSSSSETESDEEKISFAPNIPTERLKIDRDLVPVDLRLHTYLSNLAKACPCGCAVGRGSRELALAELCSDSLEDLRIQGHKNHHGPGLLDCGAGLGQNGNGGGTLKKLFLGLISPGSSKDEEQPSMTANGSSSKKVAS